MRKKWAYYNEIDPFKAQVIREAMKAGAITEGDVDERSIVDVRPDDVAGYLRCHWFAGGAFWDLALNLAGWGDREVWTGSCPCPSFSAAGKGSGFDDPRHLWPDWAELIGKRRPPVIFGEQADDAVGYGWLDLVQTDMEAQAYSVGKAILGTCSVGGADIRQRLYFVAVGLADSKGIGSGAGLRDFGPGGQRRDQHSDSSGISVLGNSQDGGCGIGGDAAQPRGSGHVDGTEFALRMGEPIRKGLEGYAGHGRDGNQPGRVGENTTRPTTAAGASGGMADDYGDGCDQAGRSQSTPGDDGIIGDGAVSPLARDRGVGQADTRYGLFQESQRGPEKRNGNGSDCANNTGGDRWPSPLNGPWRDADWLLCRDGKWRPVESGTFPLAHGDPCRLGRLRLFGDAINVEVARTFIEAYLDTLG